MRAGSRRGVLGSVGHGAGRDHVCSQVGTERYSLRMYARGSERTSEFRPVYGTRATRPPVRGVVPRAGVRRTRAGTTRHGAGPVRRGPSARMTRIVIHGQTTRSSLFRGRFVTRYVHDDGTWRVARSVRYYILLFRCVGRSLRSLIVRRGVRSDPCTCTVERSTPTTT